MMLRIPTVLFVALFLINIPSKAQEDFVVTVKGDTLFGKVNIFRDNKLDRVQIVANDTKSNYSALETKAIQYDGKIYHPIGFDQSIQFMELLKEGFLSLYGYRLEEQTFYNGRLLYKKDGSAMDVPNIKFRKSVVAFLSDCDAAADRVQSKEFKRNDINQIVDTYNSCMNEKTTQRFEASEFDQVSDQKLFAVHQMLEKVQHLDSFPSQNDAQDLLKDIASKIESKKAISNYQIEALKGYLGSQRSLKKEMEELIAVIQK